MVLGTSFRLLIEIRGRNVVQLSNHKGAALDYLFTKYEMRAWMDDTDALP